MTARAPEQQTDEVVIDAQELRRRYGTRGRTEHEAVRGVSLQVRRGELFALLGTNGAGKTSTVELLEGLALPHGGQVRVLGHDPYRQRAQVRPRTGMMLQSGGFPGDLTVAEVARFWASCTQGAQPVAEVLEKVRLAHRRNVRVKQLSGGESRRLDLGLALIGRPDVLFLDEPTTGMDPEGRRDTWQLVRDLRDEGTTVLLTTHYLEEAAELADRLAIMKEGRVVAEGTSAELVAAHPSRICFELPDGQSPESVPALPGAGQPVARGRHVTIETGSLQATLTRLLAWAAETGVALERLDARSASLEEAFLAVAEGRSDAPVGSVA
ncbi:ABC transporter ATP-binding protein [Streptomyces peucetius]|uniref:ABC transporter ATP-binding protein n=1 Tax=Streptomyces peucetius TaxID=1950 RepID=A0ABY6I7Z6_STRPE|nr:ABC transporter ATP-binding protein [Streptomyces peucetius]UYQ63121.1 ABC transporter ATP-binding protein [Streptomyces peucetius]